MSTGKSAGRSDRAVMSDGGYALSDLRVDVHPDKATDRSDRAGMSDGGYALSDLRVDVHPGKATDRYDRAGMSDGGYALSDLRLMCIRENPLTARTRRPDKRQRHPAI